MRPELVTEPAPTFDDTVVELTPEDLLAEPIMPPMLCSPWLPAGSLVALAGPGGSGKSSLILSWAVHRAIRKPWIEGEAPWPHGKTLIISAEDTHGAYVRKLQALISHLECAEDIPEICDSMRFAYTQGKSLYLITLDYRPRPSQFVLEIRDWLDRHEDFDLVVIETGPRFVLGNETPEARAALVEALTLLTGAQDGKDGTRTVVSIEHTGEQKAKAKKPTQYDIRGSTILSDGARAVLSLRRVNDSTTEEDSFVLRSVLTRTKCNEHPGNPSIICQMIDQSPAQVITPVDTSLYVPTGNQLSPHDLEVQAVVKSLGQAPQAKKDLYMKYKSGPKRKLCKWAVDEALGIGLVETKLEGKKILYQLTESGRQLLEELTDA